jgi:hypothetical protein
MKLTFECNIEAMEKSVASEEVNQLADKGHNNIPFIKRSTNSRHLSFHPIVQFTEKI